MDRLSSMHTPDPPPPRSLGHLRARDRAGWSALAVVGSVSTAGLSLALQPGWLAWSLGQLLLALAFLQWFVVLHEAGHKTLFRSRRANLVVGHLASLPSLIPFLAWRRIHARHHKYTGWQDLDATTALLVPRRVAGWERVAIDLAWLTWLPLFSILYRLQNFWNVNRVEAYLRQSRDRPALVGNCLALAASYALILAVLGPGEVLVAIGPGLVLSLMAQDVILLSQHTHMPTNRSEGEPVRCFAPMEQEPFTRTLRMPAWLSRLILGFDLHELHHMYVHVPGYDLHRIPYRAQNEVHWLTWLNGAKRLSGKAFLFGNRDETGFRL